MFPGHITAFGTPLTPVGLRSRFGGTAVQQWLFCSAGGPLGRLWNVLARMGFTSVAVRGVISAGCRYSAGILGWRIAAP